MEPKTSKPRNFPCILLVAAFFFSSCFGVFTHPDDNAVPLDAEHCHAADVEHSHSEHPDGIVEFPQTVVGTGNGGLQALVDGDFLTH